MSEAVRRSGAANVRRKRTRLRFPLSSATSARYTAVNARWSRTLNQRLLLFRMADLLCSRSTVAATGDTCAAALKSL